MTALERAAEVVTGEVVAPLMADVPEERWPELLVGRTIARVETRITGLDPLEPWGDPNVMRLHFTDGGVVDVDMLGYDGDVQLAACPALPGTKP